MEQVHLMDAKQHAPKTADVAAADAADAAATAAASASKVLRGVKSSAVEASAVASADGDESFMRAVILRAFDYVQVYPEQADEFLAC
jgi:hypothetical protein